MQGIYINAIQALAWHTKISNQSTTILSEHATILKGAENFINLFHLRLQKNGRAGTLSRYKSIYNGVKSYVLGVEEFSLLLDPFIKTTKQGVPLEIKDIIQLIRGDSVGIRLIMTVLRYFESIKLPKKFDELPITKGYSGKPLDPIIRDFKSFLKGGFKIFGISIRRKVTLSKLVCREASYRLKSGPMGPSILTSHLCAMAIRADLDLLNLFRLFCELTQNANLMKDFGHAVNLCNRSAGNEENLITGRISLASQPAGKTRLFAICNFGIQSALKPLHDCLMQALQLFAADGTFDQIGQFNRILSKTEGRKTYCFDLSKATDRFPIVLQQVLLEVIVGEQIAKVGRSLITFPSFKYGTEYYKGSVGQPLGAYSSGAMFALTHHMIVQYCYFKTSKKMRGFNDYALLGDDICIGHPTVALFYQRLMNDLGIEINMQKSFAGLTGSGEFANRLFAKGQNISGFGFPMVYRALQSISGWIRFLEILEIEGYRVPGAIYLAPGHGVLELSRSLLSNLVGMGAQRNCFAHNLFISCGNITLSTDNFMEQLVLQRIALLYGQVSSYLRRSDYLKLIRKIENLSKCGGVVVRLDYLDIIFIDDELVSHPLVRYLNLRNNIIFDKIERLNDMLKTGLFSTEEILKLSSYSEEEFIPSLTVDIFFAEDLNEVKFKIKTSTQTKAIKELMRLVNLNATEGENFQ